MHSQPVSDTSTQAMTEVALGLSMAFFALLIVALLSFQMPEPTSELPAQQSNKQNLETQLKEPEKIQLQPGKQQAKNPTEAKPKASQFIFYYQGRFIDQQLQPVLLTSLPTSTPVVLAVEQSLSFAEVMTIRHKINHPNLSITLLSDEWQRLLEQQ
jgi:hypothetical protein